MAVSKQGNYLGRYLIDAGYITEAQLNEALELQAASANGMRLGQALIALGYITEEQVAETIAGRAGVPLVSLNSFPIDPAAVTTISKDTANRYQAIPIAFEEDSLVVAMSNPLDVIGIDDLRLITGFKIKPVAGIDVEIAAAIDRYGQIATTVAQPVEEVAPEPEPLENLAEAEESPAVKLADLVITQAVESRASDIHVEPGEKQVRIRYRIDGVLHDMTTAPKRLQAALVSRLKIMANMDIAEHRLPQDGRMTLKVRGRTVDIRAASLPSTQGEKIILRLLNKSTALITLQELGLSADNLEIYRRSFRRPYGAILNTGPTGSGKSTTLYATLAELNTTEKNIVTVEDPVEYSLEGITQMQVNPQAGLTFASSLPAILRADPDIIMVGEIRDYETARMAVEAALTGHLVLSSLHTNDAAGAISRLVEMGIEPFLVASALQCVLAQRLVRVLCPHCKQPYWAPRETLEEIAGFPLAENEDGLTLYRPQGCIRCSHTGYWGRTGVFEVLAVTDGIRALALERASARQIKEVARQEGMVTLPQDAFMKVKQGITSLEEAIRVVA